MNPAGEKPKTKQNKTKLGTTFRSCCADLYIQYCTKPTKRLAGK
jgi:hypothetical protein